MGVVIIKGMGLQALNKLKPLCTTSRQSRSTHEKGQRLPILTNGHCIDTVTLGYDTNGRVCAFTFSETLNKFRIGTPYRWR